MPIKSAADRAAYQRFINNSPHLVKLKFMSEDLTEEELVEFFQALAVNTHIKTFHLYLIQNIDNQRVIEALIKALHSNTSLEKLNLSDMASLGDNDFIKRFTDALKNNSTLKQIILNSDYINAQGAKYFADLLCVNNSRYSCISR